jgi:hypothetical protein
MSNKYEREIEEILRNLERTEPKRGLGQRRAPRKPRERRSMVSIRLSFADWCLIIAAAAALISGGWAYAVGAANVITGAIALIGVVCIALVALSHYIARPRYSSPSTRYNNVTALHRNPLSRLTASWHLLMLKLRYRNRNDRER